MNRVLIDSIIDRARDVRHIEGQRTLTSAALVDITLDVALQMAAKTSKVADQPYVDSKVRRRAVQKLCADWRAVVSGVRAVYDDHPISNRHLYGTLLAHFPSLLDRAPILQDVVLREIDHFRLLNAEPGRHARQVLHEVMIYNYH